MNALWLIPLAVAFTALGWALRERFDRAGDREMAKHARPDLELMEDARRRQVADPRIADETENWIDHSETDGIPDLRSGETGRRLESCGVELEITIVVGEPSMRRHRLQAVGDRPALLGQLLGRSQDHQPVQPRRLCGTAGQTAQGRTPTQDR